MKILIVSDIHGREDFSSIADEAGKADMIIVAGDMTHFGTCGDGIKIVEKIAALNPCLYCVSGNCDDPCFEKRLAEKGLSIHCRNIVFSSGGTDYSIAGIGGSLPTPFPTLNTYDEDEMEKMLLKISADTDILVSHQPPFGTSADIVRKIKHTGSKILKKFIEENSPLLCICGHIHESSGISKLGGTTVVNPGAFKGGKYAVAEFEGKTLKNIILKPQIMRRSDKFYPV